MQFKNKKFYKIPDSTEKLLLWQKEFDSNISIVHQQIKEVVLYFICKAWINPRINSSKKSLFNISSLFHGSKSIEPDEDFFVVNRTTWYAIKSRIRVKEKPLRKLGYFCNKKLVFIFSDLIYFFYKDKLSVENKIYEGYITFTKGHSIDNVVYILESLEINNFFSRIQANKDAYKQILYYKGCTFELTLKHNIQNKTDYNETKNSNFTNRNKINNIQYEKQYNNLSHRNKLNSINGIKLPPIKRNKKDFTISNEDNSSKNTLEVKMYKDHSKKNIKILSDESNINKFNLKINKITNSSNVRSREQSGNKSFRMKNFLNQESLSNSPEHFPENRKLSKNEEDKLDKIIKCLIYYYCFNKKFMLEFENIDDYKEIYLCLISKEWLDYFLSKYNFNKIKEYLDRNYDNVEQRNYLEYKKGISKVCNIKDFILVKTMPINTLEKEFTELGQEYFENYEFINKYTYENMKELFGSFDIEGNKEYKINILKDKGLIINYNSTKIEITKRYINSENEENNINHGSKDENENNKSLSISVNKKRPERYLVVLSNGKHMNYKIKRPLEDEGIDEGLKHIGIEKDEEEINEEIFQIKLKSEIIGNFINITNPPDKTLGNFIPTEPCFISLEKNNSIYAMNSIIHCLSNIPQLTGHLLNKKRIQQIYIQREAKPLSYEYVKVLKNLWLNENIKTYSPTEMVNFVQEMNPFLSGNESDIKDLLFFLINNMHHELNKIENPIQFIPNNLIKYNYQLVFEMFTNYFNTNFKSIISELFYGLKNDTLTCDNCRTTSHSLNNYDIMNFSLDQVREFKGYSYDTVFVEECFDFNERKIELYNCKNYFCDFCNKFANAKLTSKLISIPKILVLVLGRKEEKDFNINVVFEEILNLRKYAFYDLDKNKYELIGVVSNISEFREEKNYIAFNKSSINKKWYLYEDNKEVVEVQFNEVKEKGKANVLIYNCIVESN